MLSSKGEVAISIILGGPFSWTQQVRKEEIVECIFLHVWLGLDATSCYVFLFFFELLHGDMDGFTSWLLLNFSSIQLDFVVHSC
jgi:hypothetical protein